MANARMVRIREPAWLARSRDEPRIHSDPNDVVPRSHRRLAVAAVENEVLSAEREEIGVRPAVADPLIAWNADQTAAAKVRRSWRRIRQRCWRWIRVQDAEATFR